MVYLIFMLIGMEKEGKLIGNTRITKVKVGNTSRYEVSAFFPVDSR